MAKVGKVFGFPSDARKHTPDNNWPLPKQLLGLEFEAEGVGNFNRDEFERYYNWKEDGSLRDQGLEFVFSVPLMGEDLTEALNIMERNSRGFVLNERTGLHIHLDCREQDQNQTYRLFQLYALFEYFIYKFIGDNRDKSNFCIPWYRSWDQYGLMAKLWTADEDSADLVPRINEAARYMGLNIASLAKFGSVEFRHMQNTHDFQRIKDWICIVMELKRFADESTVAGDPLLDMISKEGAENFARRVVPTLFRLTYDARTFAEMFSNGMDTCRELAFSAVPKPFFMSSVSGLIAKHTRGDGPGAKLFLEKRAAVVKETKDLLG
jgi:hypothetical protein